MKATGVTRKVDGLGRIVLPMELRNTLQLPTGTDLEIFVDGDQIILRKYQPGCTFCDNMDKLQKLQGKLVCPSCLDELVKMIR